MSMVSHNIEGTTDAIDTIDPTARSDEGSKTPELSEAELSKIEKGLTKDVQRIGNNVADLKKIIAKIESL